MQSEERETVTSHVLKLPKPAIGPNSTRDRSCGCQVLWNLCEEGLFALLQDLRQLAECRQERFEFEFACSSATSDRFMRASRASCSATLNNSQRAYGSCRMATVQESEELICELYAEYYKQGWVSGSGGGDVARSLTAAVPSSWRPQVHHLRIYIFSMYAYISVSWCCIASERKSCTGDLRSMCGRRSVGWLMLQAPSPVQCCSGR